MNFSEMAGIRGGSGEFGAHPEGPSRHCCLFRPPATTKMDMGGGCWPDTDLLSHASVDAAKMRHYTFFRKDLCVGDGNATGSAVIVTTINRSRRLAYLIRGRRAFIVIGAGKTASMPLA